VSVDLSVLDLAPESEHEGLGAGIGGTLELARAADDWGYRGFWLAEHHLSPGVSSATPAVPSSPGSRRWPGSRGRRRSS
jgi:alkanesulfonate monooxygenase SsuD/methylene tetrahydromethanopterin reductase-like flavin-dependent oxidoreductase (luciferase family)